MVADSTNSTVLTRVVSDLKDRTLSDEELQAMLGEKGGGGLAGFGRLRTIGLGGVGAVFSAMDPGLRREVALKMLRCEYRSRRKHVAGFIREARITAQIDHPNIVPVHRIGYSPEAGLYFTMKRIKGRDLRTLIRMIRQHDPMASAFFPLSRRLEIFISVCQGVAFAHSKGIVHCDLKPSNIMVGDFGEVMIMDWGLAVYRREKDRSSVGHRIHIEDPELSGFVSQEDSALEIPAGAVAVSGTPAFMSPEQAAGREDEIDERSDIYGLGTILYCLLTLEPAPVNPDRATQEVLRDVTRGRIARPRRRAPRLGIPRELDAVVCKAMSPDRRNRYASAKELMEDARKYWNNYPVSAVRQTWFYRLRKLCMRRPLVPVTLLAAVLTAGGVFGMNATNEYARNKVLLSEVRHAARQADVFAKLAQRSYRNLQNSSSVNAERDFFRQVLEFDNYEKAALEGLSVMEYGQVLSPGRKKALLTMLCRLIRLKLDLFQNTDNFAALQPAVRHLQARWRKYLPDLTQKDLPLVLRMRRIARGQSSISLDMPANVRLSIRRSDPDREKAGEWMSVGERELWGLPAASYLVRAVYPDGNEVFFPVETAAGAEVNVRGCDLPEIPGGFALVQHGRFLSGDPMMQNMRARNLPDYFIQKHEVTFGEYLEFWRQIRDPAEKELCRAVIRRPGELGMYAWDDAGKLYPDLNPSLPVAGIPGQAAEAYCRYRTGKTGLVHRLPTPLEWEKAARGVDGRMYVWGNRFSKENAHTRDHSRRRFFRFAAPPGSFPEDRSVYGVMDMAGNMREIVRRPGADTPVYRVMGASYLTSAAEATAVQRGSTGSGDMDVGFRCVIEPPKQGGEKIGSKKK